MVIPPDGTVEGSGAHGSDRSFPGNQLGVVMFDQVPPASKDDPIVLRPSAGAAWVWMVLAAFFAFALIRGYLGAATTAGRIGGGHLHGGVHRPGPTDFLGKAARRGLALHGRLPAAQPVATTTEWWFWVVPLLAAIAIRRVQDRWARCRCLHTGRCRPAVEPGHRGDRARREHPAAEPAFPAIHTQRRRPFGVATMITPRDRRGNHARTPRLDMYSRRRSIRYLSRAHISYSVWVTAPLSGGRRSESATRLWRFGWPCPCPGQHAALHWRPS
jgi:hypothetical protein